MQMRVVVQMWVCAAPNDALPRFFLRYPEPTSSIDPDFDIITKDSSRDCSSSANAMAALALQPHPRLSLLARLAVLLAVGPWGQTTAGAYDATVCGQMGYTIPFNNMTCMSPLFIQHSFNSPVPVSLSSRLVRHAILASFSSHT